LLPRVAELKVGSQSKPEKPFRETTILAALFRNVLIALIVRLYIYCSGAYKTMKSVADIAAPDQAPAAPMAPRLLDHVRARIRALH
jgi:hypothetical protein